MTTPHPEPTPTPAAPGLGWPLTADPGPAMSNQAGLGWPDPPAPSAEERP